MNELYYHADEMNKPDEKDDVDLFCPSCDSHYHSEEYGMSALDEPPMRHYKHNKFIGYEFIMGTMAKKFYICPHCEKDLLRFDETNNPTPYQFWYSATKAVEIDRLSDKLERLKEHYNELGYNEIHPII